MMPTSKRVRSALVAALTPMVMICVAAPAASAQLPEAPPIQTYPGDPGRLGDPASWRTPEFNRDNGMVSIGAEFAYAAGYSGTGVNIGIVDSGFFAGHMREHGSLDTNYAVGDRFFSVEAQGGETGLTTGFYDPAFNDSHGTHVSGTVAASRDGVGETQRRTLRPTCTGSHSTPTSTSATRTRPTACSTACCHRRDAGADAGQRLPRATSTEP